MSSLFFHHLKRDVKLAAAAEILRVLRPGGRLAIADWGAPSDPLMRVAALSIRLLDGAEPTADNLGGRLRALLAEVGLADVRDHGALRTPLGTVALTTARRVLSCEGPRVGKGFAGVAARRRTNRGQHRPSPTARPAPHATTCRNGPQTHRQLARQSPSRTQFEAPHERHKSMTYCVLGSVGLNVGDESIPYVTGWGARRAGRDPRVRRHDRHDRAPHRSRPRTPRRRRSPHDRSARAAVRPGCAPR